MGMHDYKQQTMNPEKNRPEQCGRGFSPDASRENLSGLKPLLHTSQAPSHHALRVATAGGTEAALRAGPNTATCPSNHSATAPSGR